MSSLKEVLSDAVSMDQLETNSDVLQTASRNVASLRADPTSPLANKAWYGYSFSNGSILTADNNPHTVYKTLESMLGQNYKALSSVLGPYIPERA